MKLFWQDEHASFYQGDARHLPLEVGSIDLIITSPPYWGKRDYGEDVIAVWGDGWEGQLGLEPTWQEYVAHLCECAKGCYIYGEKEMAKEKKRRELGRSQGVLL